MAVYTDDFNRADSGNLGGNWNNPGSQTNFAISSNAAIPGNNADDCCNRYSAGTFTDDQYSQIVLTAVGAGTGSSGGGLALRCATDDSETFYRVVQSTSASNNVTIGKFVGGAFTQLVQFTQVFSNGDTMRFQVAGTQLEVLRNGVSIGTFSDGSIASGQAGVAYSSTSTGVILDTWEGGDYVAPSAGVAVAWIRA